ncbi:DUF5106 domain-containing protein [Gallalistipes aquisgranensis]|uniref:DUF5106 domain-containing protein n=1 Tax=Gallalistipes aquisgranensis TaxID=2779358 RepID=UPI001CF8E541|nr:DUF5106 domain-containing protein [Gallalistipes aquisgranensis]MBE5034050.1 DUF5106 domain-containing protein [Gallalistipes aquisgranensis]
MRRTGVIALLAAATLALSCGERSYRIAVTIDSSLPGDTVTLSGFDGRTFIPVDSLRIPAEVPRVIFSADSLLPAGLYVVSLNREDLFEIIVSGPAGQRFSARINPENGDGVRFEGSAENSQNAEFQRRIAAIRDRLPADGPSPETDAALTELQQNTAAETRGSLLSSMIRAQMPVPVPLYLTGKEERERYRREHMWDRFDFSDERLIRTPLLYGQLRRFVQSFPERDEEARTRAVCALLERTTTDGVSGAMQRYIPATLFSLYDDRESPLASDSMVLLTGTYLLANRLHDGLADSLRICFAMENARKNRIGHTAADFTLTDAQNRPVSLHRIEARYTLLYFFDPDCSVCQQVTEAVEFLKRKYGPAGLQVVSVYTESETDKWRTYLSSGRLRNCINLHAPSGGNDIRERYDLFGMPILYLLDERKRVVLKNIPPTDPVTPVFYHMNRINEEKKSH